MSLFISSVSRNDFFFIPSPVARGMFRLLMPLNPGKENGYQPRFPAKPEARIRHEGWRFFAGTAPDLACQTLAITLWQQKAIMPRAMGKGRKGVPEEKRRALQVVHLPLCPVSESRRRGATPATYVPVHVLPLHGCENHRQGGNAFLPLYAKNPRFAAACTLPHP